jgi:hypothetical protein
MAVLPVGIGSAEEGGYQIERSLRFNSADSAYLNRTPASAGNRKTWTWSGWVKRGTLTSGFPAMYGARGGDGSNRDVIRFNDVDELTVQFTSSSGGASCNLNTVAKYRDTSSWYHIVVAVDTTQSTSTNRIKVYINGTQVTSFSASYPNQNTDTYINSNVEQYVGARHNGSAIDAFFSGYLTEINFIDGSALAPTSFGEFNTDTGVWQPKAYTGSYGTNGFYLNFSDNSGTTSTTLGKDSSGNGNNWTPNNFSVTAGAGNDSLVDSPTRYGTDTGAGGEVRGNYATLNPLHNSTAAPYITNGNLDFSEGTSLNVGTVPSTIYVSSGKWYYEVTCTSVQTNNYFLYFLTDDGAAGVRANASLVNVSGTGFSYTTNDVLSIALDVDSNSFEAFKNGVSQGTFTFSSSFSLISPAFAEGTSASGTTACSFNFGQRPFAYTAPSGFKALVTTNLPTPTIEAGNEYFDVNLWTGNGSTQSITNSGSMQPDLVWVKSRSSATFHGIYDSIRGVSKRLWANDTAAEADFSPYGVSAFNSNGFTVNDVSSSGYGVNESSVSYVGWQWKANGAGVSNTDGTITSTVSANTDSGFSIVTYTGNGSAGATVGHGLGVAPDMIITKPREQSDNWNVYHKSLGATQIIYLNLTNATSTNSSFWNDTAPTSSVFTIGNNSGQNSNNFDYVGYAFASVAGYSAFGSYTGNGSTDGPFVYTGFRPAFVITRPAETASSWGIHDSVRTPANTGTMGYFKANTSDAELFNRFDMDLLSNGFKIKSSDADVNHSGGKVIYMAFAENPFSIALAR